MLLQIQLWGILLTIQIRSANTDPIFVWSNSLGIIFFAFTVPDLSQNLKLVYIYIFYITHGIIFTIVGMPTRQFQRLLLRMNRAVILRCVCFLP